MNQPDPAEIEAIAARAEAATPGPWRWYGHVKANNGGMYLGRMRPGWGRCTVMDFVRHGMRGAQPRFADQETQWMTKAEEMPVFEVCADATSKDDRRVYRDDIMGIRHPDATFIAHARQDIPTLLAALATAEERRDQAEFQAEKYEREARTLRNQCVSLDERRERAEAVVEAAEQWEGASLADHARGTAGLGLVSALANYHKATGPQAEIES